jgi:hypothetical protein
LTIHNLQYIIIHKVERKQGGKDHEEIYFRTVGSGSGLDRPQLGSLRKEEGNLGYGNQCRIPPI